MNKPIYSMRLQAVAGKLWLHVYAMRNKDEKLEVFKMCEDGRSFARNLYYRNVYGYYVLFPGERYNMGYGYGHDFGVLEPWGRCLMDLDPAIFPRTHNEYSRAFCMPKEKDREAILKAAPGFRWILDKRPDLSCDEIIKLVPLFRDFPKVELLLQARFDRIAYNKSFYALSEKRRAAVLDFLRKNPGRDWALLEVQAMLKDGLSADDLRAWERFCVRVGRRVSYQVFRYLEKLGPQVYQNRALYYDYIKMAKRCGHDVKSDYWKFPKDLRKAHNKVLREFENVKAAEEHAKVEKRQAEYLKAVKKWLKKELKTQRGVRVWIPETIAEIKAHAEALHQCLISCDYPAKVARRECLLVFIANGSRPLATAQIMKDGSLGQFYGNEANRATCAPSKLAREALEQWQNQYLKKAA